MISTTFQNGNLEVTATIAGEPRIWEKGAMKRAYYDVDFAGKRQPISKLYEVVSGGTRDNTVTVEGRTFGYELAQCDSHTKRDSATRAVQDLATQILAGGAWS